MSHRYEQLSENEIQCTISSDDGSVTSMPLILVGEEWQKLNGEVVELPEDVQWLTDEDKAEAEEQAAIEAFRADRQRKLDESIVKTSSGKSYNAHEKAMTKMDMAIRKAENMGAMGDTIIKWSTADVGTGVMVDVTLDDLREALDLAGDYLESIWGREI